MSDDDTIKALVPDSRVAVNQGVARVVETAIEYSARRRARDAVALFDACDELVDAARWDLRELALHGTRSRYCFDMIPVVGGKIAPRETAETSAPDPARGKAPGYWFSGFLWGAAVAGAVGILW